MMRRGARFHADQARWQLLEQGPHLRASQLLGEHHLAGSVDAMNLKHALGEINPDRANLHVDGPLM